ncbi:MAG: ELM1/GtrOC1 family putative glycosyltransferase [Rhodocyclaceae bacterium]
MVQPLNTPSPPVVWLITDHKPGHRSQLEGLRLALEQQTGARSFWLDALPTRQALRAWACRRFPPGQALPAPDLIVVAGHRTHGSGLAARRAHGGRLVVLMRPSLPGGLFDACVVPEHDRPPRSGLVLRSEGALNPMRPGPKRPGSSIVLIGGLSRHFGWDDRSVLDAVDALRQRAPQTLITDSRRTPPELRVQLARLPHYHPWEQCPPGWLADTLAHTETAWITADSVSMIYEALTAGCLTGVIPLPAQIVRKAGRSGKIPSAIARLIHSGRVRQHGDSAPPASPPPPLNEAHRIARLLTERFLSRSTRHA